MKTLFRISYQEVTGKIRENTETVSLGVCGVGQGRGTAATKETLPGSSFLSLLKDKSLKTLVETRKSYRRGIREKLFSYRMN